MPTRISKAARVWKLAAICSFTAIHCYGQDTGLSHGNLVHNGDFEAPVANAGILPGWSLVQDGDALGEITLDDAVPPAPPGAHAMRLNVIRVGTRCGTANSPKGGIHVRTGAWYDVTILCRTENRRHTGLVFSLESRDGRKICARVTIPEVGGDWQAYSLSLHTYHADSGARLVISPLDSGQIWLDEISIVPRADPKQDRNSP